MRAWILGGLLETESNYAYQEKYEHAFAEEVKQKLLLEAVVRDIQEQE